MAKTKARSRKTASAARPKPAARRTSARPPLAGVRVIDLTRVLAGPVLRHVAGRHGRGGDQDRGARQGRRHARLAALRERRGDLLPLGQPQQEEPHAEHEGARGAGDPPQAAGLGRRGAGELPARHHGAPRLRLRGAPEGQPEARLLLDLGLRRERPRGAPARLRPDRAGRVRRHGHHRLPRRPAGQGGQLDRRPGRGHGRRAGHHAGAAEPREDRARAEGRDRHARRDGLAAHLSGRALPERGRPPRPARQRAPVHRAVRGLQGAGRLHHAGRRQQLAVGPHVPGARPRGSHQGSALRHRGQPRDQPEDPGAAPQRDPGRASRGRVARAAGQGGRARRAHQVGGRGVRERASQGAGHDGLAAASRRRGRSR